MNEHLWQACTAFAGDRRIASGPLGQVALAVRDAIAAGAEPPVHVFDDASGRIIDLDLRGEDRAILAQVAAITRRREGMPDTPTGRRGRGRPRLGVVGREVTLLPRHWDWLQSQPGGASATLRRLVEEARLARDDRPRQAQDAAYRFMSATGGDRPGYEEALRALYAGDGAAFRERIRDWPEDIRRHTERLAAPAFAQGESRR